MNILYILSWLFLYVTSMKYTHSSTYILSSIHTLGILIMLYISTTNMTYAIPWSQSYFLYDSIISTHSLVKPFILNNYNRLYKHSRRYSYPVSHIGFLIHHGMSVSLLQSLNQPTKHILFHPFTELYYYLECSNVFIYIVYFIFKIYGKDHIISLLALYTEIVGYGYIRIIILSRYMRTYWHQFDYTIKVFSIILYMLGIMWLRRLVYQFIRSVTKIQTTRQQLKTALIKDIQ